MEQDYLLFGILFGGSLLTGLGVMEPNKYLLPLWMQKSMIVKLVHIYNGFSVFFLTGLAFILEGLWGFWYIGSFIVGTIIGRFILSKFSNFVFFIYPLVTPFLFISVLSLYS